MYLGKESAETLPCRGECSARTELMRRLLTSLCGRGRLSGPPGNNTLYFWDGLIEHLRFPFLKTILPRHNKPWHNSMAHLSDFIEQHTPYPHGLIQSRWTGLAAGRLPGSGPPATPS